MTSISEQPAKVSWSELREHSPDPQIEARLKAGAEEALGNLGPRGLRRLRRADQARAKLVRQVAASWGLLDLIRPHKGKRGA